MWIFSDRMFLVFWYTLITNFGHVGRLATSIDGVDIFCQDVSGFLYILITNFGHVGR